MSKLSYEQMSDEFERLVEIYFENVRVAPKGQPIEYEGYLTSDVLLMLWREHRERLLAAFHEGGWTEEEWEDEVCKRLSFDPL
jgi:hypothetical protein